MTALERTRATLIELEAIRKDLDLPPDSLRTIFELYSEHARNIHFEKQEAEYAQYMRDHPDEAGFLRPGNVFRLAGQPPSFTGDDPFGLDKLGIKPRKG